MRSVVSIWPILFEKSIEGRLHGVIPFPESNLKRDRTMIGRRSRGQDNLFYEFRLDKRGCLRLRVGDNHQCEVISFDRRAAHRTQEDQSRSRA